MILKKACFLFLLSVQIHLLQAQYKTQLVVAQDGSGDYVRIQDAIDDAKAFPDKRITIFIKNGTYKEKIKVHSWNTYLTFKGEDKDKTIITFDDHFSRIDRGRNSTFHTYTMLVEGNDFHAEGLTIQNTAGKIGQAIALAINADRVSFRNCVIKGNQDTMYASGEGDRHYFQDCYIEGTTDFIFGPATVVFENCQIHSLENSYITAASTPKMIKYGFVFFNCKLTAAKGVDQVYLGRPWRNYAKTVFINSDMGGHIRPEGWHNWRKQEAETTTFYAEFDCKGPGYRPQDRVGWSYQLSKLEAADFTVEEILGNDFTPALKTDWYGSR